MYVSFVVRVAVSVKVRIVVQMANERILLVLRPGLVTDGLGTSHLIATSR